MFRQHVPNYVDTDFKRVDDANTLEEVLNISWVKNGLSLTSTPSVCGHVIVKH